MYGSSEGTSVVCGTRQVHGCAGCDVDEVEEARRDGSWNKQQEEEEPQQAWKRGVEEDHGRERKKRISRIV